MWTSVVYISGTTFGNRLRLIFVAIFPNPDINDQRSHKSLMMQHTCNPVEKLDNDSCYEALRGGLWVTDLSVSNIPGYGWPSTSPSHQGSNTGGCSAGSSDDISGVADAATQEAPPRSVERLPSRLCALRDRIGPSGPKAVRSTSEPVSQGYTVGGAGCQCT